MRTALQTIAIFLLLAGNVAVHLGSAFAAEPTAADLDFFENEVRPLLAEACYKCHGPRKQESGLRLDSSVGIVAGGESGPAIVPNRPDESLLLQAVLYDGDLEMPPSGKLEDRQIQILRRWIAIGAPQPKAESPEPSRHGEVTDEDRQFWSFRPIQATALPKVNDSAWPQTPVDHYILRQLERNRIQPVRFADRRTLLRRVTFDLTGLPPTPDEINNFLADRRQDAFQRVVDRLLASPAYGERWGRHWLDVVRYADSAGETADYPLPEAYRYRNYVIDAFNADKPYDEFVREQVAGDILARQGPRQRYAERATATGFIALSRRFGYDSELYHHMTIQDTIDTLGQSVLGLSLGCARCHAHKFDPITLQDYYSLFGIFASTRYAFPGSEEKMQYRSYLPLVPPTEAEPMRLQFDRKVADLENQLRRLGDPVNSPFALGSIDDIDGDFQLQQLARGGSYGVPVDPWWYDGSVSIEAESQSPFAHAFRRGTLGAQLAGDAANNQLWQSFEPPLSDQTDALHFAFDFRVRADNNRPGSYHIVLGGGEESPALKVVIGPLDHGRFALKFQGATSFSVPGDLTFDRWYHIRIDLNLAARTFDASVHTSVDEDVESISLPTGRLDASWGGVVDSLMVRGEQGVSKPLLDFDNVILRRTPVPSFVTPQLVAATPKQTETDEQAAKRKQARDNIKDELASLIDTGPYPQVYGVAEGYQHDARIQKRGDPLRPGAVARRQWLEIFTDADDSLGAYVSDGSGRLALADWLVTQNPLAARVIANRIWQHHFGEGLVRTENDFGRRGELPTHPHLLDYLASQLVANNWSIKTLHRLIVLSSTYQLSSDHNVQASEKDPTAKLYWRFRKRRLDAESIRDAMLCISGQLDRSKGGRHPFPSALKKQYSQHGPFRAVYPTNRRSVYLMVQRTKRHPFLSLFDGPDPNASTAERKTTTVPTQALFFMNDPLVHELATRFGNRLRQMAGSDVARVVAGYQLALGRIANKNELQQSVEFLETYRRALRDTSKTDQDEGAFAAFARTLFARNEFIYVD